MTSVVESSANHLVLYGVSWETYTGMLEAFGERRLHHAYDEGTLEIIRPVMEHERVKCLIARFVDACTLELDIPIQSIGSTTLRGEKVQKGLEPDACYYISHEHKVRGRTDVYSDRDPPPDLAIEVDVTHSSVNRMDVYAALGIPEVWRATKDGVLFYRLSRSGRYSKISRSRELPLLVPAIIDEYLALRKTKNETAIVRQFIAWVRSTQQKKSK